MDYKERINYVLQYREFPEPSWPAILKSIGLFLFSCLANTMTIVILFTLPPSELNSNNWPVYFLPIGFGFYGVSILFGLKNEYLADRKFKEIRLKGTAKENVSKIISILKSNFRVRKIEIDKEHNMVNILTKTSFLTWGNVISVLCDYDRVLVNSQSSGHQLFSYGQHKRNIDKIEALILKIE